MLVSVVMAVYNGEKFLQKAIDSILAQSYQEIEVIVVNDGSIDTTKKILDQVEDERVRIIHLERNQGAANALNIAIDNAMGQWIAIHDADDISYSNRILEQVRFLKENPQLVAVGSFIDCIDENEKPIIDGDFKGLDRFINRKKSWKEISTEFYSACPLTHGTMVFSKKAFMKVGKYNTNLKITYDYELWTRLILVGPILKVPLKLYKYRVHSNSLTNKNLSLTIKESFYTSSKYIKESCYRNSKLRPTMVIFGPKQSALELSREAKEHLKIKKIISNHSKNYLKQLGEMVKEKKLSGVIVLSSYKHIRKTLRHLKGEGLKLNKNLFVFWLGRKD